MFVVVLPSNIVESQSTRTLLCTCSCRPCSTALRICQIFRRLSSTAAPWFVVPAKCCRHGYNTQLQCHHTAVVRGIIAVAFAFVFCFCFCFSVCFCFGSCLCFCFYFSEGNHWFLFFRGEPLENLRREVKRKLENGIVARKYTREL